MPTYLLSGLRLDSELELPGVVPAGGEADLTLRVGEVLLPSALAGTRSAAFLFETDTFWIRWPDRARARVTVDAIRIEAAPGRGEDSLRPLVLGPLFSLVLALRGFLPLHASTLSAGERAFAIAADSGGGKSTLAAALVRRGHRLLCDDVAALELTGDEVRVHPGFPYLKLAPEALEAAGEDWAELARVTPLNDKRARTVDDDSFQGSPLPLERIYLLEDGPEEVTGPLPSHLALLSCFRHLHRGRMLQKACGTQPLMERCGRVASRVRVYRLGRPRSLERLDVLAERVEEHMAR